MNVVEQFLADMKKVIPEPIWNILVFVAGLVAIIWTIIRSFVFVQPGQVGIRKRFGKPILKYPKHDKLTGRPYSKQEIKDFKRIDRELIRSFRPAKYGRPKYLYPGFNALIPLMHSVEIVHIRINNISLGPQRIEEPASYVAYDLPEITIDIRISDAYLWMISSMDAEAQVKTIADTELAILLRKFSNGEILNGSWVIRRDFVLDTMFDLAPIGAAIELDRGSLNLGSKLLCIDAGWDAQSRRELAQAVRETGGLNGRMITDGS